MIREKTFWVKWFCIATIRLPCTYLLILYIMNTLNMWRLIVVSTRAREDSLRNHCNKICSNKPSADNVFNKSLCKNQHAISFSSLAFETYTNQSSRTVECRFRETRFFISLIPNDFRLCTYVATETEPCTLIFPFINCSTLSKYKHKFAFTPRKFFFFF